MKRIISALMLFFLPPMFMPCLSYGAMYQWTDKNGNLMITDDLSKVPEEYRQNQHVSVNNATPNSQEIISPQSLASHTKIAEKSIPVIREIPSSAAIRRELLESARALASAGHEPYQNWQSIERQINKLMDAANHDRKNILREILCYFSYDMVGGQANELVEYYGFTAIQAYFNFTVDEVEEVTKAYLNSNDKRVQQIIESLLKGARSNYWKKMHDHQMQQIEQLNKHIK